MPAKAETFSVRLAEDTKRQVDEYARLTKRSRSFVVNEAIETYMRDRIAYLRELDAAVVEAESGMGHSSDQIFRWMNSWGADDELPPPFPDIHPGK